MNRGKWSAGILLVLGIAGLFAVGRRLINRYESTTRVEFRNWTAGPIQDATQEDGDHGPFVVEINGEPVGDFRNLNVTVGKDIQKIDFTKLDGSPIGTAKYDVANRRVLVMVAPEQPAALSLKMMNGIFAKSGNADNSVVPVKQFPDMPHQVTILHAGDSRTSYAKYKEAVVKASKNETYPDGQLYYQVAPSTRDESAFFKELINHFVNDENGARDPYYNSYTYITGKATFIPAKRIWTADKYESGKLVGKISLVEYRSDTVPVLELTWQKKP